MIEFLAIIKCAIICFFVPLVRAKQVRNPTLLGYLVGGYNRKYEVFGNLREF